MQTCVVGKMKVQVCHIGMMVILDSSQDGQVRVQGNLSQYALD